MADQPTLAGKQPLIWEGSEPIPGYRLEAFLGKGGFGEVWKALGPGGFPVAIKFVARGQGGDEVEENALELLKAVRHPHLLPVFGAWNRVGHLIVAMELGDGTLRDRLKADVSRGLPGIPAADLAEYLLEAAKGLDHLHANGVQHRDIKPENLLLVGGCVKVADFGLAKFLAGTVASHTGGMSLAYAAPEFFEGITHQQSDQFSLAVSYCQLRGNRLPFRATMPQMLIQQITGGTPDLTMLAEAEREAVARALHRDPARRWPTCRAFAQAIGACLPLLGAAGVATQPLPVKAPPPTAPPTPVPTPPPTPAPPPAAPTHGAERRETSKPPAAPAEPPPPPPKLVPVAPSASVPPVRTTGTAPSGPGVKPSDPNKIALLDKAIRAAVRANDLVGLREKVVALIRLQPGRADLRALLARLLYTNSLGMKLALIPAGQFTMGAPADEPGRQADEGPPYPVRITRPFYLGIAPVLQREYEALMGVNPASFFRTNGGGPDHPVEQVSWKDAVAFCQRLSEQEEEHKAGWVYRLPTEAEWEYACRAGTATAFAFGRALTADQANFDSTRPWEGTIPKPPAGRTTRVGSYPANGYGLYDVHGNVWEWCQDWYDPRAYDAGPRADPPGPAKGSAKVLRGGSWRDPAINCRCASRRSLPPTVPVRDVGFRVVAEQSDVILDFVP